MRDVPGTGFDLTAAFSRVWQPQAIGGWVQLGGLAALAIVGGLFVGAAAAARNRIGGTAA
jgi:hypothetical protein